VTHTAIDGALFQNEIEERNVMGVPAVFLNGKEFGQGRMTLSEIINKVDTNADARAAKALTEREPFEVLIIGSGPAG
ncbi:thioredoxin family protein, partial [Escherichia coli]